MDPDGSLLGPVDMAKIIRKAIEDIGSQHVASYDWDMGQPEISKWLKGVETGSRSTAKVPDKILLALGYQRVVAYKKKPRI